MQLLSAAEYRSLFERAGFSRVRDERLLDPTPVPENYTGTTFKTRDDFVQYRKNGSLMITARLRLNKNFAHWGDAGDSVVVDLSKMPMLKYLNG